MAQAGYTPISLYYSTTAAAVPTAGNLVAGELAINIVDGKLYYENSSGVVTLLASSTTVTNSFSAGTTGFTPSTATTGAVTLAGTLITSNGGTGLSSYTAGDLSYYASGTALTKLAIGTAGQFLTSTGTAPQWSTLSGVAVTTFSAGTTGFTPSSATSGAVTLAGTLATTNGGTGLTSFTSGGVVYASSSSALATGSALTFDGANLLVGGSSVYGATITSYASASRSGGLGIRNSAGTVAGGIYTGASGSGGGSTDIYVEGVGLLGFITGGTTQLTLTSSSLYTASGINVAFGTSSIGARLTTQASANSYTAGAFQINSLSGTYKSYITNVGGLLLFSNSSTVDQLTLDSSGNLGLGVTPSAWYTAGGVKTLQVGSASILGQTVAGSTWLSNNAYFDTGGINKYIYTGVAHRYAQDGSTGNHQWFTAPSGTAGTTVTFTQAMTLDAGGDLYLPKYFYIGNAGNTASQISSGSGSANLCFGINGTEKARIDTSGNLLVAATAVGNGGKLYVNGSISLGTTTTGAQASMAKDTTQYTSGISTTATTIYTDISSGMSSASAGYFIIYGSNNAGAGFMDVVIAKASGTPVVVSSSTIEGSPPARTYSVSSLALQLAMASGTFSVNLKATVLGYPF